MNSNIKYCMSYDELLHTSHWGFPKLNALSCVCIACPMSNSCTQDSGHSVFECTIMYLYCVLFVEPIHTGQWGLPTFNAGAFFGLLAIIFCSVIESVGDYYATAAVCRLPPPPRSVVGRGIACEGLGSFIGALMGCCHATTSYSQTIGFVGMTRVRACVARLFVNSSLY